ncbi:MAG: ribonuclease T2-like [Peltula sp. TS41687]|nr:MAG: ribonuclease T2-like [Peltula sp. TS41687]
MPSRIQFVMGLAPLLLAPFHQGASAGTPASCPNAPLSCQSTSSAGSCCYLSPGGQILQTQFWDTQPATGPKNSWTVHGLWPDHCDGTFDSYCDKSREYTDIGGIIGQADPALLNYMETYWKADNGDDETFWEHEWNKHGTCINTLEPDCYSNYTPQEEVVDYFQKTVDLFRSLNTYQARHCSIITLAARNIIPSRTKTYTSAQIQAALSRSTGHKVTIGCRSGELNEVWYHFNVRGSVQTGDFVATDPDGSKSTCPTKGIKYLPKGG